MGTLRAVRDADGLAEVLPGSDNTDADPRVRGWTGGGSTGGWWPLMGNVVDNASTTGAVVGL